MKIALIQEKAHPFSMERNIGVMLDSLKKASSLGADIALFPELFLNSYEAPFPSAFETPFNPLYEEERKRWCSSVIRPEHLEILESSCREYHIAAVVTGLTEGRRAPRNSAVFIDRQGNILSVYSKVHTCSFSLEALIEEGDGFSVFEFEGVRIGMMICFDREFPEAARCLCLQGAELILVPNACRMTPIREAQLAVRAFENMVPIALANYPGKEFRGSSMVFSSICFSEDGSPCDNLVFKAGQEEGVFLVELDLGSEEEYRSRESWGRNNRRPETYCTITESPD